MFRALVFLFLGVSMCISQDNGLDAYKSGDLTKARNIYEKLHRKVPDSDAIKFALGTTAFRQKDENTAKEFLSSVRSSNDPTLASKAYYNLGKLFTDENDFKNGLLMYRKAIILDPNDKDAKINYELLKRKIQDQDNQDQDNQDQDNQDQDNQDQDNQEQDNQNQNEQNTKLQAEAILNALQKKEKINQKLKIYNSKTKNLVKDW